MRTMERTSKIPASRVIAGLVGLVLIALPGLAQPVHESLGAIWISAMAGLMLILFAVSGEQSR